MNTETANDWIVTELVEKWENNKSYTIKCLEAMPAEDYDFVPAEGMRSFMEQAVHIAEGFEYQLPDKTDPKLPTVDDDDKADTHSN